LAGIVVEIVLAGCAVSSIDGFGCCETEEGEEENGD
jgi:hypothetical protein